MGKLISAPEAAQILGVHRVTVIVWLEKGEIAAQDYIGGGERPRPVFDRDYIVALAQQRASASTPETTPTIAEPAAASASAA